MKTVIIVNALVVISVLGIGDASNITGMATIDDLKLTVTTSLNDFALYHDKVISKYASDHEEFLRLIPGYVDDIARIHLSSGTHDIKKDVREEKEADNCYKLANQSMTDFVKTVDMEKCGERARTYVKIVANETETIKSFGNSIIRELDDIIANCHLLDSAELEKCIIPKLTEPRKSIEKLVNDVKSLMKTDDSIPRESEDCVYNFLGEMRKEEEIMASIVSKCIYAYWDQKFLEESKNYNQNYEKKRK